MQWDKSCLMKARLVSDGGRITLDDLTTVVDEANYSVSQPGFMGETLVFAGDHDACDFSNFHQFPNGGSDASVGQITDESTEFGEAHWVFGQCRWQSLSNSNLVAVETTFEGDRLVEISLEHGITRRVDHLFASVSHLSRDGEGILFVAGFEDRAPQICRLNLESFEISFDLNGPAGNDEHDETVSVLWTQSPMPIEYPTSDGASAHAYFYPPKNTLYQAPEGEKPPLMVLVHGGPTSRSSKEFSPLKQYFVSLGYALLDINHRGSTGYGRQYRQKLKGAWGEIDAGDIADGIRYVVDQGLADANRVLIRGGSAGGYAVLRALTEYGELFAGGACYYGIGNLITLSEITHKFESRYTDGLIGEPYAAETASRTTSRYHQRSPIFQIDKLRSPLILFQGLDDKVVPPAVSQEVVESLKKKNLTHEYHEYANEGHGFKMAATKIDSLTRETAFFARIINAESS